MQKCPYLAAWAVALAGMLAWPGSGTAQNRADVEVPAGDQNFAMTAAQGGMAQVQLGQLAKDKAASDAVREFGQRMVDDYSRANGQLKSLASRLGLALPADMGTKHQTAMVRLSKLSGAAFDRAYIRIMLKDHRKGVAEFQKEASRGKEPQLKNFAAGTLPTFQNHLQLVEETATRSGAGSADRMKSR